MLWILHPDPFVRTSLQHSLAQAWPELPVETYVPDAISMTHTGKTAILCAQPIQNIPLESCIILDTPRRIADILAAIHRVLTTLHTPTLLTLQHGTHTVTINTRTRQWITADTDVELTEKELAMIVYLHQRTTPATREDLLRDVWMYATDADTHTVETHIYRLRRKIEPQASAPIFLQTIENVYILAAR